MNELKKLYDVLSRDGYYTNSFEEFQVKFQDADYQKKVYDTVSRDGLYTKDMAEFMAKYSSGAQAPAVKKKEETVTASVSEPGSLALPEPEVPVEPAVAPAPEPEVIDVTGPPSPDLFEERMEMVSPELIDRGDENEVAKELTDVFKPYGFEVEPTGIGDAIKVTAANGQIIEVDLDPWELPGFLGGSISDVFESGKRAKEKGLTFGEARKGEDGDSSFQAFMGGEYDTKKEKSEAAKLKKFLRENKDESQTIARKNASYAEPEKMFVTREQREAEVKKINKSHKEVNRLSQDYFKSERDFAEKYPQFETYDPEYIKNNPEEYQMFLADRNILEGEREFLGQMHENTKDQGAQLDRLAGEYTEMLAKRGYWSGGVFRNEFIQGAADIAAGAKDFGLDTGYNPEFLMETDPEFFKDNYLKEASARGYDVPSASDMTVDEFKAWMKTDKGIPAKESIAIQNGIVDTKLKRRKRGEPIDYEEAVNAYSQYATSKNMEVTGGELDALRRGLDFLKDSESTPEAADLMYESFWGGALLGVTRSLPAMLFPGGWAGRTSAMYSQITGFLEKEMAGDPDFQNISEAERFRLKLAIGSVSSVLEAVGLRNVLKQQGLLTGILMRVLKKTPANVKGKAFNEVVMREVNSAIGRGALVVTSAGLAEFETGFLQEGVDIGFKSIYNEMKEKEMFETPEGARDIFGQMLYAGAQEAVGGFVLGTPGAVSAARGTYDFTAIDKATFEMFQNVSNLTAAGELTYRNIFYTNQQARINRGEISKADAQQEMDNLDEVIAVNRDIPSDLTEDQQKRSLGILLRKKDLQEQIEGKDPILVKRQQEEIDGLNRELDQILYGKPETDAIQEQGPESVDAPESTRDSEAVGEGVPDIGQPTTKIEAEDQAADKAPAPTEEVAVEEGAEVELEVTTTDKKGRKLRFFKTTTEKDGVKTTRFTFNRSDKSPEQRNTSKVTPIEEALGGLYEFEVPEGLQENGAVPVAVTEVRESESGASASVIFEQDGQRFEGAVVLTPKTQEVAVEETVSEPTQEVTEEERMDIDEFFGEDVSDDVDKVSDNLSINRKQMTDADEYTERVERKVKRVKEIANRASIALLKVAPDVKIVLHETPQQYNRFAKSESRGEYKFEDKTIHINLTLSDLSTVPHEVFHALLLEKALDDPNAVIISRKMLESVRKTIDPTSDLAKKIDKFVSLYGDQPLVQDEEYLAELTGILTSEYRTLSKPAKSAIKDFIRKLAKMVGLEKFVGPEFLKTDEEVIDLLNTISRKIAEGDYIEAEEVAVLDKIKKSTTAKERLDAETAVEKALDKQDAIKAAANSRRQIVGERANLEDDVRDGLDMAIWTYIEQGDSKKVRREVKAAWGWEKGADGKWRYEIETGKLKKVPNGTYKLSDVYDAPELYKAYPEAKDIDIAINVREGGAENSWFVPEGVTESGAEIEINVKEYYRVRQDLIHELQHYIQFKEGFAIGGNTNTAIELINSLAPEQQQKIDVLRGKEAAMGILNAIAEESELTYVDDLKSIDTIEDHIDEDMRDAKILKSLYGDDAASYVLQVLEEDLASLEDGYLEAGIYRETQKIEEQTAIWAPYQVYERLIGEVEARNAVSRDGGGRSLIEDSEDTPREDQLAVFGEQEKVLRKIEAKEEMTEQELDALDLAKLPAQEGSNKGAGLFYGPRATIANYESAKTMFADGVPAEDIEILTGWNVVEKQNGDVVYVLSRNEVESKDTIDKAIASRKDQGVAPRQQVADIPQSAKNVLYGDSDVLPKPSKKKSNSQVAQDLAEVAAEYYGGEIITSKTITPEQEETITEVGTEEAIAAFEDSGKSAADWYSTAIEKAMAVAAVIHPSLSSKEEASKYEAFAKEKDPVAAANFVMRVALAITSQNLNVEANAKYANEQFDIFKKTGRFDASREYGTKAKSISSNLRLANVLVEKIGLNATEDFVLQEFNVSELEVAASKALGKNIKVSGLRNDSVNGAALFGPKIGQGFLQNLMGKFDPVTIDLWLRRTWGRWTGDVVGVGVKEERMARLLNGLKEAKKDTGVEVPDVMKKHRVVRKVRPSTGASYDTMSDKFISELEEDADFRDKIAAFAKTLSTKGDLMYKLIKNEPMSDGLYKAFISGEKTYGQTANQLQRIKDKLSAKYKDYVSKEKAKGRTPLKKSEWVKGQNQKDGRVNSPNNEAISARKPEWVKAATSITNDLKPIEIPTNQDRKVITRIVNDIKKRMTEQGYPVTNADVQALLWYPEKDIWAKLRGEEESNLKQSYDDQFIKIAEQKGLGKEAKSAAENVERKRAAQPSGVDERKTDVGVSRLTDKEGVAPRQQVADIDKKISNLKAKQTKATEAEYKRDKAGKPSYSKAFFAEDDKFRKEIERLELLKLGLAPAYEQRVKISEELDELNKPFEREVGNKYYPRLGTVSKGEMTSEDSDLGGIYEAEVDGYLFRGVSVEDYNRIKKEGFIDTDLRGAISDKEGINLTPYSATAFNYLPEGVEGIVMAIKVSDKSGLFMIGADDYVRSSKPIPFTDVEFVTTPVIEGRYLSVKDGKSTPISIKKVAHPSDKKASDVAPRQQVVYHVTIRDNKGDIQKKGLEKDRPAMWAKGIKRADSFDTSGKSFAFSNLEDAIKWGIKTKIEKDKEVSIVAINAEGKTLQEDKAVTGDPFYPFSSAVFTEDVISPSDILSVEDVDYKMGEPFDKSGEPLTEDSFDIKDDVAPRQQVVYRGGDLTTKAEERLQQDGSRGTGHFGTGFYFFSDKERAESYANKTGRKGQLSEIDLSPYRLAEASENLHDALKISNIKAARGGGVPTYGGGKGTYHTITPEEIQFVSVANSLANRNKNIRFGIPWWERGKDTLTRHPELMMPKADAARIAAEATRLYNESGNTDSASTSVMKALGFEGVNAVGTPMDNSTYGTVIYDLKEVAPRQQLSDIDGPSQRSQKGDASRIHRIISEGRDNNFTDAQILDYLVRKKYATVTQAKDLMKFPVSVFADLPQSFRDIEGGIKVGLKLYNRVEQFIKKETDKNKRRKVKISQQEIMDLAIANLEEQAEYKAETDTQQMKMQSELQKSLGIKPTKNMAAKLRGLRKTVRERAKGARNLKMVQTELRNFIRKSLPKELYTKREVMDLIRKITAVKTSKELPNLIQEVVDFVSVKNVDTLQHSIKDRLNGKYVDKSGKRIKGLKIDPDTNELLKRIREDYLVSEDATFEDIADKNAKLSKRFAELEGNPELSEAEMIEMGAIEIAMRLNNSRTMLDTDVRKAEDLGEVDDMLGEMIIGGREIMASEIRKAKAEYERQFAIAYESITGQKIDLSGTYEDDNGNIKPTDLKYYKAELEKNLRSEEMRNRRKSQESRLKKILSSLQNSFVSFINMNEALDGLMDKIDKLPGEMFGGNLQQLVTERVDQSSIENKARMMALDTILKDKLKELFGKNWEKISRENAKPKVTGIIINAKAIEKAKKAYEENPSRENKQKLNDAYIDNDLVISQNEAYYLYNQYKDPANEKSFENKFGPDYKRIMQEITDGIDPRVKEFADWQVNELFPTLYENYNSTYRNIFRVNMPWNEFYAGRIYREGVEQPQQDLLPSSEGYKTAVGASSTMSRVENSKPIQTMDGTQALMSYLNDMEYFAAYAETIRDIDKIFSNKYISSSIESIYGKRTVGLINDMIKKLANKGGQNQLGDKFVNNLNNVFIFSRLGISPVITLKQFTSTLTYANDIGYINWVKYSAKNLAELRGIWKEVRENSVYMQDRKFNSITKAIETYKDSDSESLMPGQTKNFFEDVLLANVKFGDRGAIYLGGLPNYSYYKAEFKKKNPKSTEQEAIDYAVRRFERDTKRTQQSSDLQDKDYFQTGNPIVRQLNVFLTTPKQYFRKEIQALRNINRKIKARDMGAGKGSLGQNWRTLFTYHILMPVFFQWVAMGLPGMLRGWRDDDDEDLLRAAIIGNINAIFILGEIAVMIGDALTGKPWDATPKSVGVLQIAAAITNKAKIWDKTKDPVKKEEHFKRLLWEISTLTGMPGPTLNKMAKNIEKLIEGGEDPGTAILRLFNYSEYQIEGPKKKKKGSGISDAQMKEYFPEMYEQLKGSKSLKDNDELNRMKKEQKEFKEQLKESLK